MFVLQIAGAKRWRIHEPVLPDPLPHQTWDGRRDQVQARAAEEPLIDTLLEPGDALYLPRGYLHSAVAQGELSIHLTIGVHPLTGYDLARELIAAAEGDRELRRSLPLGVDVGDVDAMKDTLAYKKVCVVQDNSDYGVGLAKEIISGLGDVADSSCAANVKGGDKDFSATVQLVNGASPDAVFYAGYYSEAAPFVQQLRDAGMTATFVSADGTNDPQFVAQAGASSKDALLSCPCGPAPAEFATAYEKSAGQAPGVYSVEGYDLTTIM